MRFFSVLYLKPQKRATFLSFYESWEDRGETPAFLERDGSKAFTFMLHIKW